EKPKKQKKEEEKPKEAKPEKKQEKAEPQKEKKEKTIETGASRAQPASASGGPPQLDEARVKASPVARRVAAEFGVDLSSVKGTGPEGRVTETDVRAAAKSVAGVADRGPAKAELRAAPSIKAGESARIQLSGMRKIIAQRLVESLGPIPHFYLTIEVNAGPLMEARAELKSAGESAE